MAAEPEFVDATDEFGGFKPKEGSEILRRPMLVDVDGDGFEDILVWTTDKWTIRLFMNYGGKEFIDETEERGLGGDWGARKNIHHCTAFDLHNHGHYDLYIGHPDHGPSDIRLFLNDGTGHFVNSGFRFPRGSKGSGAMDVNGDGFIDLFDSGEQAVEGGTLFINRAGESLVDETLERFAGSRPFGYQGPVFADFDNDGYPDIFTTGHYYSHCYMYRNDGEGHFIDVTDQYDLTFKEECDGADGAVFADLNNSGSLDLIAVKNGAAWIHENVDNGKSFPRRAVLRAKDFVTDPHNWAGEAAMVADFDNDGYLDIWVAGTQYIYRNEGDFKFTKAWFVPVARTEPSRQACFGDVNNDGKIDILYGSFFPGKLQFIRNEMPDGNNWLQVKLIGPYGDAGGYGVRVSVFDAGHAGDMSYFKGMRESGSGYMYHVSPTKILHFGGLSGSKKYDLVVRLPFRHGNFTVPDIQPGQRITIDCRQQAVIPQS